MKLLLLPCLFAIVFGCSSTGNNKPGLIHAEKLVHAEEVKLDSVPGLCPYLTKDHRGNTVLSWVRIINDSSAVFCYAVSKDGKKFGSPVVIPGSDNIQPHG